KFNEYFTSKILVNHQLLSADTIAIELKKSAESMVFGLLNFFAYGAGTAFLFLEWKSERSPNTVTPTPANGRT
ncbi:unnamed protein product, partial [Medioppia subpectinata]